MTDSSFPATPEARYGQPSADRSVVPGFGWAGGIAGLAVILVVMGGLVWAAAAGKSVAAQRPQLFGGYLVLEDSSHPFPVIDLASGSVSVRIAGVQTDVRASGYSSVQAVPVDAGTMLVNTADGTFNLLGTDNFVLDTAGGGVGLGPLKGSHGAYAVGAGSGAYIVRYASPRSTVSLVDQATVASGARLEQSTAHGAGPKPVVTPRGFSALSGPVPKQPGSAVAAGGDLWVLVGHGTGCQVVQLHPVATGHTGLLPTVRTDLPASCGQATLDAQTDGTAAVAWPGHVRIFAAGTAGGTTASLATGRASQFLPVTGSSSDLWFLARLPSGWSSFGVSRSGRATHLSPLGALGPRSNPVSPVVSGNLMYTLDQSQAGQPTLWSIVTTNGAMVPLSVRGSTSYPAASRSEKALFTGTQVLVDGPRVIFNNPNSLEAVVVFTDRSRPPAVIDKSLAQELSSTGPSVIPSQANGTGANPNKGSRPSTQARSVPVVQAVNPSVNCATTTQKPYAPQITSIAPSSGSALVSWSYQLLDVTDCEPDSWSVHMRAISGSHQPLQPTQVVNGQDQLQFTGLRPATTYQVTVTAYINTQATPSAPATFTTTPRGPDAPTSVHTTMNAAGDWVVSWTPCAAASCVVPADEWNVVGSACGSSFVPQPPSVQVAASQDTVTINADSLGLLGDSLSFSVNGQLASGLAGNPTSDGACTQSWHAPAAPDISVAGVRTVVGQSVTARLQVSTSANVTPVEALGSRSTEYVFHVGSVTLPPSSSPAATVPGLEAGHTYVPSVTVYPAGHPGAAVTVTGAAFSEKLAWPLGQSVEGKFSVDSNPNHGTATIDVPGYRALVPGQPYSSAGSYTCGNTQSPLPQMANGVITIPGIDLDGFSGSCTFSFTVSDNAARDNAYGGVPSPPISGSFDATNPNPPSYELQANFSNSVCLQGQDFQCVYVTITDLPGETYPAGDNWQMSASGGPGSPCNVSPQDLSTPPDFPQQLTIPCDPGQAQNVAVTVTYEYLGQTQTALDVTPSGTPPTTTTTTSSTTTSTTTATTSSTSVSSSSAAARASGRPGAAGSPKTELAAARGGAGTGDAGPRRTFELTLAMLAVALFAGMTPRNPKRRTQEKGDR